MRKGISIWLDVPLEALARRIVAVGTGSRPLLNHGDGDPYTKVGYHFCRYHRKGSITETCHNPLMISCRP